MKETSASVGADNWEKEWTFQVPNPVRARLVYGKSINELELGNTELEEYDKPVLVRVKVKLERPEEGPSARFSASLDLTQEPANGDPPSLGSLKQIDIASAAGKAESVVVSLDNPTGKIPSSFELCRVKEEGGKETPILLELEPL